MAGKLILVATPIGNLGDLSARALQTLGAAEVLACEDTRRTRTLLSHYDLPRPAKLFSYREDNERSMAERLLAELQSGNNVTVCTDGGYPGISDPGYRIIRLAVEHSIEIEVVPGASAVPIALLLSGLSTASYTFKGFPPRKPGPRKRFFAQERDLPHTMVVYESPYRTGKMLADAAEALGAARQAAVCIELTKKFERVSRGTLRELAEQFAGQKIKGEVVVVIAGAVRGEADAL